MSQPEQLRFAVRGMTCASCVAHVRKAVEAVPGVAEAAINLPLERADVLAPAGAAAAIARAIADEGYEARLVDLRASTEGERQRRAAEQAADEAALGRATLLSALLTLPIMILEMGGHLFPAFHHWQAEVMGEATPRWIALGLATLVVLGPGLRFARIGVPALLRGRPEMNALVTLGAGAAYLYSAVATIAPGLFPPGGAHVYFESAAVIVTLVLLGRYVELRSKGRTGAAIAGLMALQPATATRIRDGKQVETPVAEIMAGDIVLVRPGAGLPVDGEVIEGESYVNEAMLTGEPVPVAKQAGAAVHGGSVNGAGALTIRATRVGNDTLLAGIIRLVEQAQGSRLPIQGHVDRITAVFVPIVLVIAAVTFGLWLWLGPEPALPAALVHAVSVLIIACPCAMGLATPISVVVATGRAAQFGALFRRGDALERLGKARVIAFDKTGTLTRGQPEVVHVAPQGRSAMPNDAEALSSGSGATVPSPPCGEGGSSRGDEPGGEVPSSAQAKDPTLALPAGRGGNAAASLADPAPEPWPADEVLALAAAVEASSEHPIARAITRAAEARGLAVPPVTQFAATVGMGAAGLVEGRSVAVGAARFMTALGLDPAPLQASVEARAAQGETPFFIAIDGRIAAFLSVADPVKPDAARVIAALKAIGLTPALISGDHPVTARAVASTLGIADVAANVLPGGKVDEIARLKAAHGPVIFVGDGLNDAPALAAADVGIAVGDGATVAIESADIVLVSGNLAALPEAIGLSRATMRNIRQNLVWAFGYNVALIPVAAGLFQPALGWSLSPMLAAGAMAFSSIFVVFNALRLARFGAAEPPASAPPPVLRTRTA